MSHRRNGTSNGNNGMPDWLFWILTFIGLAVGVLILIFGEGIWL